MIQKNLILIYIILQIDLVYHQKNMQEYFMNM